MNKFFSGALVGSVITATVTLGGAALAYNGDSITAIEQYVNFKFDGLEQYLPSGYTSIVYQDHVYVPARFVAEQLGAKVGWDDSTQTVTFQTGATIAGTPQPLPVSFTQQMVTVTVTSVEQKSGRTIFHVKVTNNSANTVSLARSLTQIVDVNGKQSDHPRLDDTNGYPTDIQWNQDIQAGATLEGTLTMNAIPSGSSSVKLYIPVQQTGGNLGEFTALLNIQLIK